MIRHVAGGVLLVLLASPVLASAFDRPTGSSRPVVREIAPRPVDDVSFPSYPSIEGNVTFWKHVYASWSMQQVAVHDLKYPGVIYDVVDLPGNREERYTEEQRDFVDDLNELWRDRLEQLEKKVAAGNPLSDDEKSWALRLTEYAGSNGVENAHKRIRTQRGLRERFRRGLEISYHYDDELRRIFRDAGLPEDIAVLPHVESSFQTAARSSAGALGAWQFTRSAGKRYMKINSAVDQRMDPVAAARGAARYLRDAHDSLQDWPIALTSYNHGVTGMRRAVKGHGTDYEKIFNEYQGRTFGFASKNFYSEFLAAREIAADPIRFFPEGLAPEAPLTLDRTVLDSRRTPAEIAAMYGLPKSELAEMNPAWTSRAVRSGLSLPKGLEIWLPSGTLARVAGADADSTVADSTSRPVPDDSPVKDEYYFVRRGDTLSTIARAQGMSVSSLRSLNGIPRGKDLIRVGQRLVVDGNIHRPAPRRSTSSRASVHIVRRGETLSTIAGRHGITVNHLRRLNGMVAGQDLIQVGQKLRLAGDAGNAGSSSKTVHIVRRGESLSLIAERYGLSVESLRRMNRMERGQELIHAGQRLSVRKAPDSEKVHIVRTGDNLTRIASSYGIRLMDLLRHNRLTLASVIQPGQSLRIPH